MPLAPPSCIQLKTRSYKGTLITLDGYANTEVSKDNVGRSLTGTRFSGRRCSIPVVSPSLNLLRDLSDLVESDNNATSDNESEHSATINVRNDTIQLCDSPVRDSDSKRLSSKVKLFYSTPSLATLRRGVQKERDVKDTEKYQNRAQRRRMSDTFAVELATFKRNREIRLSSGRRLSEFLNASKARRLSQLIHVTSGGLALGGAVSKWISKVKKARVTPLQRFRNYAKLALMCVRLCKYSHQNVESAKDEYLSIIQVTEDFTTKLEDEEGIYFDPTVFRANKEERLPTDARKILQKDPKYRTSKDLSYIHIVLRSIKAFAEYPTKMQEQICKVAWYECYESKRAIVRQGQPPLAFYFILSGSGKQCFHDDSDLRSVVVTRYDRRSGGTTFLVALHRGMSFGELAVINKAKRQATVSTATTTEFLCISGSDFVEIFMAGGIKSVTDPENSPFIRSIPFLKHWPIECLAENPQACMFHFFGRGQVLVRDSNHSDWIYVVKSGSLSVLKKLVEVHPRAQRRNESDTDSDGDGETNTLSSKSTFGTWDFRIKRNKYLRRDSGEKEVFKNNIEADKRLEQTLPGYYNNQDRLGVIDYDHIINDHKSRVLATHRRASSLTDQNTLPRLNMTAPDQDSIAELPATGDAEISETEDEKLVKLPKIRRTSKHVEWGQSQIRQFNRHSLHVPKSPPKGAYLATTKSTRKKVSRKEAIQEELFQKQLEYDKKLSETQPVGRKTIVNELDNKPIKDFTLTEKDIRPMFVQVQVLEKGQHFGLTKTVFPEQAESFSVVSNGAECIMISKKFFMEKATEATLHHLRQVETLLPPEEELQNNLQDFVDWRAHRARVYKRLVTNKISRTVRHNQFPPAYEGQYSFRTGPTVKN